MPKLAVSWWLTEHSGHGVTEVIDWLVVWNSYLFFHILGMSSSQLTNSYFSEGYAQPPTSRSFWPGTVLFLQSSNRRIPPHSVDLHQYLDSLGSNHRGRHATDEEMGGHGWTWCKSTAYIHIMSIQYQTSYHHGKWKLCISTLSLTIIALNTTLCRMIFYSASISHRNFIQVQLTEGMDATEREITFVRWSTPLIVGISNLIFASFTGLRVALDQASDRSKKRLSRKAKVS